VLPATLTLIERKEGTTKAWADASGGALGAVGLAAFALTASLLLRWNPVAALLLALLAWALVSVGLYSLFRVTGLFLEQDELLAKRRWPSSPLVATAFQLTPYCRTMPPSSIARSAVKRPDR